MKILTFPCTNGVHSHIIPPYVLYKRYFNKMAQVDSLFLLPGELHKHFADSGLKLCLSYPDHRILSTAQGGWNPDEAIDTLVNCFEFYKTMSEELNPDIILDDNEPLSTLMAGQNNKPRISIFRTGFFRSIDENYRNAQHTHSMEKMADKCSINCDLFLKPDSEISKRMIQYLKSTPLQNDIDFIVNYLKPKTKLIPGIRSIEPLPDDVRYLAVFFEQVKTRDFLTLTVQI